MPYITNIEADGELNTALANFNTVCIANAATLGLAPGDLTEIAGASTAFTTTFNAATAAKASANAAVESKDIQKKASKAIVSKWAKKFRSNPSVPDNLLEQLMVAHHKTPGSHTPPTEPLGFVGSADGNGLVSLKWNRNGNINGTTFAVEMRTDPSGPWEILGVTTKTKFDYLATPGSYIAFRVTASRNGQMSPSSTPFALWENGGGQTVALKLAA